MTVEQKETLYSFLNIADAYIHNKSLDITKYTFYDDLDNTIQEDLSFATDSNKTHSGMSMEILAQKISSCTRCLLSKTRKNTVPGVGVQKPLVLVIGEGPGADEDAQGEPFVGKAGQLLDKMLAAIDLSRTKNCFIANIVKCRPPQNRDPLPEESTACSSFLQSQIQVLQPKLILAVGRIATQNLLNTSEGINKLRGKFLDYKGIPLMATYHPSALLRDESLKRPAWEDLKLFRLRLQEIVPGYENIIQTQTHESKD